MARDEGAGAGSVMLAFLLGAVSGAAVGARAGSWATRFCRRGSTEIMEKNKKEESTLRVILMISGKALFILP